MPANPQTFYTVLALAKETTWGTTVARTAFLPIMQPRFQPNALRNIVDNGLRGLAASEFDLVAGPGEASISYSGNVYADTFPHLLVNILGADTIAGAGPYTHTIRQANQPSSHTFEWAQNVQPYLFGGSRLQQLSMSFNATDGLFTYQAQAMSRLGTTVAATTPAFTANQALPGWNGAITVAGSAPATLLEGSIQLTRGLRPIHGLATTRDIADLIPLAVTASMRLTFEFTGITEYNYFTGTTPTKNAVVVTMNDNSSNSIAFTSTSAGWRIVDIEENNNIYTAVAQINCIYNATDIGVMAIVANNARSTAY